MCLTHAGVRSGRTGVATGPVHRAFLIFDASEWVHAELRAREETALCRRSSIILSRPNGGRNAAFHAIERQTIDASPCMLMREALALIGAYDDESSPSMEPRDLPEMRRKWWPQRLRELGQLFGVWRHRPEIAPRSAASAELAEATGVFAAIRRSPLRMRATGCGSPRWTDRASK